MYWSLSSILSPLRLAGNKFLFKASTSYTAKLFFHVPIIFYFVTRYWFSWHLCQSLPCVLPEPYSRHSAGGHFTSWRVLGFTPQSQQQRYINIRSFILGDLEASYIIILVLQKGYTVGRTGQNQISRNKQNLWVAFYFCSMSLLR